MATPECSIALTRRQLVTGLGLAAIGTTTPVLRLVPAARANTSLMLPMIQALHFKHFLDEMAMLGSTVVVGHFAGRMLITTGVQLITEGLTMQTLSVRVAYTAAGYAVTFVGMSNVAVMITAAGLIIFSSMQPFAPQVRELDIEFVPDEQWQNMTGGDITGTYPGQIPMTNRPQAWIDLHYWLGSHPGACAGRFGYGSGCYGGQFGGGSGPTDGMLPPGEVILHPIYPW
jgi:hypothetical protein